MNENKTNPDLETNFNNRSEPERKYSSKSSVSRKIIIAVSLLIAAYLVYSVIHIFASPDKNIQQIYLVPSDAAFIIQSGDPVKDWKKLSSSAPWQTLKKAKSFEEVAQNVETLDSIIRENNTLLSLVGKRDMLISVHKTRATDFDFLIILDLQKASKIDILKEQIENVLKMAGNKVTQRKYKGISILEMRDPETRKILYSAFVDNHFVASYTSRLLEASIDSRDQPVIGLNYSFIEAERLIGNKGLYRFFINYNVLPQFMAIYLGGTNEYVDVLSSSMEFAGLYLDVDDKKMELSGYTIRRDTADPYMTALLNSGKHKMKAHEIMSARTALYTNIGFSDPMTFTKELENALSISDKGLHETYINSRKKIESLFGISLDENFLNWMSGEFAVSQSEPGLLGREPEMVLAIRAKSIKDARKNMEFIEKKIKNRTPVKIKSVSYKEYEINYVEMKGFFRLFFGKMFDKFEKPYYTYVDDYVVFSNRSSTLLSFVEDYEQKNLLKNNDGFKKALSDFNSSSTFFLFTDMHKFYPQLKTMLTPATWKDLQTNKEILYSFPYWTMQITGDTHSASLKYNMDFKPYEPENHIALAVDPDEEDQAMNEEAESEKELMNELKRFYVEKFQGNVLREFYPEGELKSETEIKEGKKHGRYREYYESGKLKVRGKYRDNRPKGTWKYYTEEGKFERKEKF